MAEKLGLKKEDETAFMGGYLKRVRELPGREGFRTGISLQASFKKPSDLPRSGSSDDRFIFFVSFPYFGRSRGEVTLNSESESVKLLDFKRLGVEVPERRPGVSEAERDYIRQIPGERGTPVDEGEILVHQAQYMLFDNSKLSAHVYCLPKHLY